MHPENKHTTPFCWLMIQIITKLLQTCTFLDSSIKIMYLHPVKNNEKSELSHENFFDSIYLILYMYKINK